MKMSTPSKQALLERRRPFHYQDSDSYQTLLEFMVLSTVLINHRITKNQISSLFRNLYLVPEECTKSTVDRLVEEQAGRLIVSAVVHEGYRKDGSPVKTYSKYEVQHLDLDPALTAPVLVSMYKDRCEVDPATFSPEVYMRPVRASA